MDYQNFEQFVINEHKDFILFLEKNVNRYYKEILNYGHLGDLHERYRSISNPLFSNNYSYTVDKEKNIKFHWEHNEKRYEIVIELGFFNEEKRDFYIKKYDNLKEELEGIFNKIRKKEQELDVLLKNFKSFDEKHNYEKDQRMKGIYVSEVYIKENEKTKDNYKKEITKLEKSIKKLYETKNKKTYFLPYETF